jgi:hypothetical protein
MFFTISVALRNALSGNIRYFSISLNNQTIFPVRAPVAT